MENEIIFTHREKDIIFSIAEGLTNKEIGQKLFISSHTVKAHLEKIYEKTNLHNRAQLIVFAYKKGLLL